LEDELSGGDDSGDSNPKRQLPSHKEQAAKKDNGLPLAKNLKKMFGENPTHSSTAKGQNEKKAKDGKENGGNSKRSVEGTKPLNKKKSETPQSTESSPDSDVMVPPELLAALAGPNGDKDKILNMMKANGLNAKLETRQTEFVTQNFVTNGIAGAAVKMGGVTLLGAPDAVQSLIAGGGATVLGQPSTVSDFMNSIATETTEVNMKEEVDGKKKKQRKKKKDKKPDKNFMKNKKEQLNETQAQQPVASDCKPEKVCWFCHKGEKSTKLSKCRGCRKVSYPSIP